MSRNTAEDPPPFLGRWSRVYVVVLVYLVVLIAAFRWFGEAWS